jgi:hypothetical protein
MSLAYAVAYLSWPLFAAGVASFFVMRWRREHGQPVSNALGLFAIVAITVPIIAILMYGEATETNVFVEDVTYIPGGFALLLFAPYVWRRAAALATYTSSSPARKKAAAVACVIFGIGAIFIGTFNTLGDFVRDRIEVSGVVTGKHVTRGFRKSPKYYVEINGRSFPTTADLFDHIDGQRRVRAMIGRASGTIFEITEG